MAAPKNEPDRSRPKRPIRSGTSASQSEKLTTFLRRRATSHSSYIVAFCFAGILAAAVGGILWFNKIYADPQRVFWGMINNNLSSAGVTKEISRESKSADTNEFTQLVFNTSPRVRDVKKITAKTTNPPTRLVLEDISTPKDDYQHYVLIDRPANAASRKPDYSKVYKMWLKTGGAQQQEASELFNNSVLAAVLFGNIPQPHRTEIVQLLQRAYKTDFSLVSKQTQDGRRAYVYKSELYLQDYARAAHLYAETLGLPVASRINPSNYRATDHRSLILTVDVMSRQLKQVIYKSSGLTENYSNYGLKSSLNLPAHTVTSQEFQEALQAVMQ